MYDARAVREVCLVFVGVAVASLVLVRLGVTLAIPSLAPLGVAMVFLFTALGMADRRGGAERFGIALGGLLAARQSDDESVGENTGGSRVGTFARVCAALRSSCAEIGVALLVCFVVFPFFAYAYVWWFELDGRFAVAWPRDLFTLAVTQILVVALPEEAFFRGYVQTRLADAWPERRSILGAHVSLPSLFLQAALFAILHFVVEPLPDRLAVFFPALVFGWLRAFRHGIGAALLFHAACNVYSELLSRSVF